MTGPDAPAPGFPAEDFHPGARVEASDGVHVGSLDRVIVDGDTWDLRALVVEETRRFSGHQLSPGYGLVTEDLVVPLAAVASVTHDRITLSLTATDTRRLPPYLAYQFAPLTAGAAWRQIAAVATGAVVIPRLVETADKPGDDLEIRHGESVMLGHSGHCIGHVEDVLFDGRELVGIAVKPAGFLREPVILQVRFLERSDDAALFAHLTASDLEHLRPFHPAG